jgi:hypothetical protein
MTSSLHTILWELHIQEVKYIILEYNKGGVGIITLGIIVL